MTTNQAKEVILQRFLDNWTVTDVSLNSTFENETFDPPNTAWVRVAVRSVDSQQDTMGPVGRRKYRRSGMILVQVFDVANTGTSVSDGITQAVRDLYEGEHFSGIWCKDARITEQPGDAQWFIQLVEVDFDYFETR